MADTLQHGSISGSASVRQRISGEVVIGGKIMKELRFLPYSEFPEIGREETLYIDTDNNAMYYYDGSAYVALSGGGGGGTDNYNALTNKPSVNSVTLIGNKTSSELGLQELISDLSTIRSGATSGSTAVQPETLETALSEKQDTINDLDDIRSGASAGATAVQPSDMETALADKQDVISDLSSIRSGAASGATAVQPDDMETALSSKQDVISDLSDIRSGASAGATAVQPSDMETALSGKQDTISDLQTIRNGAALGATAVQPSDMETALADKQDVISDLDTIRSGATAGATALQPEDVDTLPTDGSSNPVSSGGTYNFVNSSIATNTAYFIGTFASVADLEAYTGTVTNNDYAFVSSTDSAGNTLYNRYKYNAATQEWSFEYAVNNTAFTAAQWAAIQSGLTASDKTKLDGIEQGANKTVIDASPTSGSDNAVSSGGVHTALSGKQDTIADLSDIRSGASSGATAVQPSALNDYQTKLSGTNKLDPAYIEYDASHRAVSDTEKSTWSGKQDIISDLQTIRSGAAAGATALQQSDVTSTYSASGTSPVNGTAVNAAIETLDVSSVGGSGKYISAISEEDGKISATPTTFDTSLSSSSTNNNAPTSKTVYDDQQRQEVEIGAVANAGAKNLFKNTAVSKTYLGAVFTVNEDGTVSLSGAATTAAGVLEIGTVTPPAGSYIVSGCPAGGSWAPNPNKYRIRIAKNGAWLGDETGSGYTVTVNGSDVISLQINSGVGVDTAGLVFKPMIRCASITDNTFVPYAPTNRELCETKTEQTETNVIANLGAKNNADFNFGGVVQDANVKPGTIVCVESNGTFSFSGTSADKNYAAYVLKQFLLKSGTYKISGISGGSNTTYWMRIGTGTTDTVWFNLYDAEREFNIASDTLITVQVVIYANQTVSNLVFKPMIRPAAIIDSTFQPYALSNPVITPALIEQVDAGAKNLYPPFETQSSKGGTGVTYSYSGGIVYAKGTKSNSLNYIDVVESSKISELGLKVGDVIKLYNTSDNLRLGVLLGDGTTFDPAITVGNEVKEVTIGAGKTHIYIRAQILSSFTGTVDFSATPMVCKKSLYDISPAFVSYALPNPTLTPAVIKAVDEGAKNLLKNALAGTSSTKYAVTATFDANGVGTISGTNNSTTNDSPFSIVESLSLPVGHYHASGCPSGGAIGTYRIDFVSSTGSVYRDIGNGVDFDIAENETIRAQFVVYRGKTSPTGTVQPMICTAADWAISQKFVPYRPSWQEMWEMIQALQNNS